MWAMAHAYHFNPEVDPAKVVFDVEIDIATFQIVSFRFSVKNEPKYGGFFSEPQFRHLQGSDKQWVCILTNQNASGPPEYFCNMQWRPIIAADKASIINDPGGPYAEWPWIAVHLTQREDQSSWVAMIKWNLLITAVHNMRLKIYGSLDKFKAPILEVGVTFIPPDMDLWYEKLNRRLIWDHLVDTGYVAQTLGEFAPK
jgi:hypothetical protein